MDSGPAWQTGLRRAVTVEVMSELQIPQTWRHRDDALEREFEFADFAAAIRFIATAAPKIDALNHHPEWTNVYNTVSVRLTSHDTGGVTERDVSLAHILDEVADGLGA